MPHIHRIAAAVVVALVPLVAGCGKGASAGEALSTAAAAGDDCCANEDAEAKPDVARFDTNIPDVELTDQFGKKHRFYSDLIRGKLVLLNAIYTTCAGTCPMQTTIFAAAQHRLRKRIGKDVSMISVTLDPVNDTPEKLKAFAERFNAHDEWLFLTGPPQDVATVLQAMDLWAADPAEHLPFASVGNDKTGVWMKVVNLGAPEELVSKLDTVSKIDPAQAIGR